MKPIDFQEANFTFKRPENMTEEECSDLRVFKGNDGNGSPIIISKWELSDDDIERIKETKSIYFSMLGVQQPPIALMTETPFIQA